MAQTRRRHDVRVVLLFNPSSGGASREREIARLGAIGAADGHEFIEIRVGPGFDPATLRAALMGAGALVVAGGDGTLHHALEEAVRMAVPVYHVPMGTENLFARQFGMSRKEHMLRRVLGEPRTVKVDVGDCNGRLFALMCSVGPDAAVIHRLSAGRRGSISRWSYLPPMLKELGRPPARVWAALDGETVVDGLRGVLVVANSRQYALRTDPAINASMTDGLLDLVFLPVEGSWRAMLWLVRSRLGIHLGAKGCVYATGRHVRVETDDEGPPEFVQVDGEAFGTLGSGPGAVGALEITVRPGALRVLVP